MGWSERALAQLGVALEPAPSNGCAMRVRVKWGPALTDPGREPEWLPGHRWIHIGSDGMRHVVARWTAGDAQEAADELLREFLKSYPLDDAGLRDIEVFDLRLVPSVS
jgi:hypothetical protein